MNQKSVQDSIRNNFGVFSSTLAQKKIRRYSQLMNERLPEKLQKYTDFVIT